LDHPAALFVTFDDTCNPGKVAPERSHDVKACGLHQTCNIVGLIVTDLDNKCSAGLETIGRTRAQCAVSGKAIGATIEGAPRFVIANLRRQ
jgi:hypothetical protein